MSFELHWERLLAEEPALSERAIDFLNQYIAGKLPDYLQYLRITRLKFGAQQPSIRLLDIRQPMDAFYAAHSSPLSRTSSPVATIHSTAVNSERSTSATSTITSTSSLSSSILSDSPANGGDKVPNNLPSPPPQNFNRNPLDTQLCMRIDYDGGCISSISSNSISSNSISSSSIRSSSGINSSVNGDVTYGREDYNGMELWLETELQLNIPTPSFISLPIELRVSRLRFSGSVLLAYLTRYNTVSFCFDSPDSVPIGAEKPLEVIVDAKIESELGDQGRQIMKNVSKIERFLIDLMRRLVTVDLAYPNCRTVSISRLRSGSGGSGGSETNNMWRNGEKVGQNSDRWRPSNGSTNDIGDYGLYFGQSAFSDCENEVD